MAQSVTAHGIVGKSRPTSACPEAVSSSARAASKVARCSAFSLVSAILDDRTPGPSVPPLVGEVTKAGGFNVLELDNGMQPLHKS